MKTRWAWTGISDSGDLESGPTSLSFAIVTPTSFPTVADVTVERVLIDYQIDYYNIEESTPLTGDPQFVVAVLDVVPTNNAESAIVSNVQDPLDGDIDTTQKRTMWTKWHYMPPLADSLSAIASMGTMGSYQFATSASATANVPIAHNGLVNGLQPVDIRVRRKLGGDQALILKWTSSLGVGQPEWQFTIHVWARALLRIGKK